MSRTNRLVRCRPTLVSGTRHRYPSQRLQLSPQEIEEDFEKYQRYRYGDDDQLARELYVWPTRRYQSH